MVKKTSKSQSYWKKRQDERLAYSERVSNDTIADIAEIYKDSLDRVNSRIDNIMSNYAKDLKMPIDELKEKMMGHDVDALLKTLYEDLLKTNSDTKKNVKWLKGNYLKRLSREEGIKLQLENERRIVAHHEARISKAGYEHTVEETYKTMTADLLESKGKRISTAAKESMLKKHWVAGGNYSSRVWNNTGRLKNDLDRSINAGILGGQSSREVMNELSEKYDVAMYRAETLVRTEMNYFENATELRSYKDFGVTHYLYFAVRDARTSDICAELDEQRFSINDAEAGKNYPPMHPNCRAGTLPDLAYDENTDYGANIEQEKTFIPYKDVTQEWLDAVDHNNVGKVIELDYFEKDGIRYDSSNATFDDRYGVNEKNVASWLVDTFRENVEMVPRVNTPEGISTPDYIFKGEGWDLKTIKGNKNQTIYRSVVNQSEQASNFIIDLSKYKSITFDDALDHVIKLFSRKDTSFIDNILIREDDKLRVIKKKIDLAGNSA